MSKLGAVLAGAKGKKRRYGEVGDPADKAQALLDGCHPAQRAYVADESKRIAALCGGRAGKTTAGRARLLRRMLLTPKANCLFITDTKEHARDLAWAALKDLIERLAIDAHFAEVRLVCTLLDNGSQLKLVGADDHREIDKLRGIPRHEVGIDEAASFNPRLLQFLIERVLEPRLGDYDGTLWLSGTPGHILSGPFYEITRPGSDRKGWSVHQWAMADAAPYVPAIANAWRLAHVNRERNGWSDDHPVWKREYLGLWAADDTENVFRYRPHDDEGKPLNQWDAKRDAKTGFAVLPEGDWVYVYGADMGHSDPFALVVLAHNPRTNELRHVFDFQRKGMHVRQIAELLVGAEWCERVAKGQDPGEAKGVIGITGWPYGIVADTSHLGGAILDELREVYGIPIEKAEQKNKHDAIEITNGDFIDQRLWILKGSELEVQLFDLQWAVDDIGRMKVRQGQEDHLADGLIYARRLALHLTGSPVEEEPDEPPVPLAPPIYQETQTDYDLAPADFDDFGNEHW